MEYIGQSINIRQRWRAHHIQGDLCDLSDLNSARRVQIAWLPVEKAELDQLEIELIRYFKPRLNANHISVEPKPNPVPRISVLAARKKDMLTVREVTERLDVGQSSVRLWAKDGRFPGAQLEESPAGSYWLIPDAALDSFSKQKPGPKPSAKKKAESKKGKAK